MTTHTPKDILDQHATTVIRKNRVFEKDGSAQVNSSSPDNYKPETYTDDIVLWHAPKNWIRLEFEDTPEKNRRIIAECESALKGYDIQYCVSEHEGAKSPYLNICNIKDMPLNADNKLYKEAFIDLILPSSAKEQLDKTNYQWTLSPVIGHPHWKPKYHGAIHQIVRGIHPLDQKNEYLKELKTKIERLKKYAKTTNMELTQNNQWVTDFLINYCTSHLLPKGSRHRVIEKNLAILIFHRTDRDDILNRYLIAQGRTTDTLRTWTNAIIRGEYREVSILELKHWINDNNIEYVVPQHTNAANTPTKTPITKETITLLQDPKLLLNLVDQVHKMGVVGEENVILTLINKISLRLVKGHKPTSSNMVVSDVSGAGKDAITGAVTKLMVPEDKLMHRTRFSDKALEYMMVGKDENETLDEMVFYLEDPEEDMIKSQAFRVLASGQNEATVVKDQTILNLKVKGKPVIIVTSMNTSIDLEGERRWDAVSTDTSKTLTKLVMKEKLRISKEGINHVEKPPLAQAIQTLKSYEVLIPYADQLYPFFETIPSLIMRTQIDKLLDYIKSSAVLHQHQREKDNKGRIIADGFDYEYAKYVFLALGDAEGGMLNPTEKKLVEILKEHGEPITITELCGKPGFPRTRDWVYKHFEDLKTRHIIGEKTEFHDKANKFVAKIYNIVGVGLVVFGCIPDLYNQNKEGCIGFINIVRELNENRTKIGLSALQFDDLSKTLTKPNTTTTTNTTSLLEVVLSNNTTIQNQQKPQHERIREVETYCQDKEFVSITTLTDNFDKTVINHLIESGQLLRIPNHDGFENYQWYARGQCE